VHLLDGVPHREIHLEQRLVAQDPGVVDEHVEPGVPRQDFFDGGFPGEMLRDIEVDAIAAVGNPACR
jgi:hypothetical protein